MKKERNTNCPKSGKTLSNLLRKDSCSTFLSEQNRILSLVYFAGVFALILSAVPFIISCSGKESFGIDNKPPEPLVLIPHLGDTGDPFLINGVPVNDTNNGIDTVPDNDWIRIQWQPVYDQDLNYIKIFRFGDYSPTTFVDSLSRADVNKNEYLDTRLSQLSPVGQTWSYFVEGYDLSGNYSVSDTVSYGLLQKPILLAPHDFAQVQSNNLSFQWLPTIDSIHYRVLVFDSDNEYIWHYDYYIDAESEDTLSIDYWGPDLTAYEMIVWRVDTFDDVNLQGIAMSGAESYERVVYLIHP